MFKVSVIICTHQPREDYLRRVLQGLRDQTLPMAEWELLLLDNASPVPLSEKYDLSWQPNGRHVREEKLGVAFARLRGVMESTAAVMIFVDDDAVLAPDYLEQALIVGAEWPFIGAWGGSCVPEFETPLPGWIPPTMWRLTIVEVKEDIWSNLRDFTTVPIGAGLCCRRAVGERYVARWRENPSIAELDRKGAGLAGYGDIDLCHCAMDIGLGTGKSHRLSLTHLIRASRLTEDYFVRHAESDAASYMMFRAQRGYPIEKPKPSSWLGELRWWAHRVKNRVPREVYETQKAARRGMEKGYRAAEEYRRLSPSVSGENKQ